MCVWNVHLPTLLAYHGLMAFVGLACGARESWESPASILQRVLHTRNGKRVDACQRRLEALHEVEAHCLGQLLFVQKQADDAEELVGTRQNALGGVSLRWGDFEPRALVGALQSRCAAGLRPDLEWPNELESLLESANELGRLRGCWNLGDAVFAQDALDAFVEAENVEVRLKEGKVRGAFGH